MRRLADKILTDPLRAALRRLPTLELPERVLAVYSQRPTVTIVELLDDFFPVFEKKNNNKNAHRIVRRFVFAKPPGALAPFAKGLKNIGLAFLAFYGAPSLSFWTTQNDIETETIYNGLFALGFCDADISIAEESLVAIDVAATAEVVKIAVEKNKDIPTTTSSDDIIPFF